MSEYQPRHLRKDEPAVVLLTPAEVEVPNLTSASAALADEVADRHRAGQATNLARAQAGELVVGYNAWRCAKCRVIHPVSRRSVGCGCA